MISLYCRLILGVGLLTIGIEIGDGDIPPLLCYRVRGEGEVISYRISFLPADVFETLFARFRSTLVETGGQDGEVRNLEPVRFILLTGFP